MILFYFLHVLHSFPKGGQLALPVADGEEQDNHWPKEY